MNKSVKLSDVQTQCNKINTKQTSKLTVHEKATVPPAVITVNYFHRLTALIFLRCNLWFVSFTAFAEQTLNLPICGVQNL